MQWVSEKAFNKSYSGIGEINSGKAWFLTAKRDFWIERLWEIGAINFFDFTYANFPPTTPVGLVK